MSLLAKPYKTVHLSADATSMVLVEKTLYVATAKGTVELFSWPRLNKTGVIKLPKVNNAVAGMIKPQIFSIDVFNGKVLIVSQGKDGYRNLFIYENKKLKKVFGVERSLTIVKAAFVSDDLFYMVDLGAEAFLYDRKEKRDRYRSQISTSSFSSFTLNVKREKALLCDESGELKIMQISNGEIIKRIDTLHKDNVYMASWRDDVIFSAGLDRKASYLNLKSGSIKRYPSPFVVYTTGVSPSGKIGAFSYSEDSDIKVVNFASGKELALLKGHENPIVTLIFADERTLVSAAEERKILIWRLP